MSYQANNIGIRLDRRLAWIYFEFDKELGPRCFAGKNIMLHTGKVGFRLA